MSIPDHRVDARLTLSKCYAWSTVLYDCETWTSSKTLEKRVIEMWTFGKSFESILDETQSKRGYMTNG